MTDKPKKKKRRAAILTVDFVTAYHVDECRQRLASHHITGTHLRTATEVSPTGRFTVDMDPHARSGITVQFEGHLDPVENGTHVHGGVTPGTRKSLRTRLTIARGMLFGTGILVTGALLAQSWNGAFYLGFILGLNTLALYARHAELRRDSQRLALWVHAQLFLPIVVPTADIEGAADELTTLDRLRDVVSRLSLRD